MIVAEFYDKNMVYRGPLPILGGALVIRNNAVCTGVLDVNGDHKVWHDQEPYLQGGHVAIKDGDVPLVSGKFTKLELTKADRVTDVTLQFNSHLDYLAGMITLPSPNRALTSQTVRPYYKETGPAETVIADMVRSHVGQNARVENREPIHVEPSQGRGNTVTVNSRFKNLLEEAQALAGVGGVQFRSWIDEDAGLIRFGLREPVDRSLSVELSEDDGTLEKFSYSLEAPSASRVLVAGQGEGTSRMLRLVEHDQTDWDVKTLLFQDRRDTEEETELIQAGEDTLADHVAKTAITIDTRMLGKRRFGVDYFVGDIISVQLTNDVTIIDPLQRLELSWDATGTTYKVSVGPYLEEPDEEATTQTVRRLRRSLRGLEAQ